MPLYSTELRYLPHLDSHEILRMGLRPATTNAWIETDQDIRRYYQHKCDMRSAHGDAVYRAEPGSHAAQQELSQALLAHLLTDQPDSYQQKGESLLCQPGDFLCPLEPEETLWGNSLWVADDLVLMQERKGAYHLTAASLCSPSHWSLAEKFGRPLREIHDPIPGFHPRLTPRIDRFFAQLRPGQLHVRYNWSLQPGNELEKFPDADENADKDSDIFYRVERQSLKQLPDTGAIVFTIRVYLHPLEELGGFDGALASLFQTIDTMPAPLLEYKGLDRLLPALEKYKHYDN